MGEGDTGIGPYEYAPAELNEHDPRADRAAALVADMVRARMPELLVEHVGSSAVPGCAGKGVVDLLVVYPEGCLVAARDCLDGMGFQHQTFGNPFPEERPMRVGSVEVAGVRFRVHAHVIAESSPEARALRRFRDRLRTDPRLMERYVARKRELIDAGVVDSPDYAVLKGDFIRAVLDEEAG